MNQIYVVPVADRRARHELTHRPLPKHGQFWPDNTYTRRLLMQGDIARGTAPGAVPPVPAQPSDQVAGSPRIAKAEKPSIDAQIANARALLGQGTEDSAASRESAPPEVAPLEAAEKGPRSRKKR